MPARTVVIEKLTKWNGETHAEITPSEYTQLTGRAGRRGIDVEGDAVVLWQPGFDPQALAGLASTRTYPLRSSFSPTYNMAVNLVRQMGRHTAREVLETSFAQFQADRAVVGLARQLRKNEEALAGYAEAMSCHLGDFVEYASIRRGLSDREKQLARDDSASRRAEVAQSPRATRARRRRPVAGWRTSRSSRIGVVIERGRPERLRRRTTGRAHRGPPGAQVRRQRLRRPAGADRAAPAAQGLSVAGHPGAQDARRRGCARSRRRRVRRQRRGSGAEDETLRGAACPAAGAPVPRLHRARGPRPLGRALAPAAPGDPGAAASRQRPHRQHRPHLRPGGRGCSTRSATSTATP